jgi:hypothetical protein
MAEQPGDRGTNWFAIELTSAFVDPGEVTPHGGPTFLFGVGNVASGEAFSTGAEVVLGPPPPIPEPEVTVLGGPVPDSSQMVHAGPAFLREIIDGELELVLPAPEPVVLSESHDAILGLQRRVEETHEVALHLSNFMLTVRRDDEEFLMLF